MRHGEDELLRIDRLVRRGLGAQNGETIRSAARRTLAEHDSGLRRQAALAVLHSLNDSNVVGMKRAADILEGVARDEGAAGAS